MTPPSFSLNYDAWLTQNEQLQIANSVVALTAGQKPFYVAVRNQQLQAASPSLAKSTVTLVAF
jgi:hypothetical protein